MTLNAAKSGSFKIAGDLEMHRLGYGAMRITGEGVWGEPKDRAECLRTLKRLPELGLVSKFVGCDHDVERAVGVPRGDRVQHKSQRMPADH